MSDLSVNQPKVKQDFKQQEAPAVETGGILASATNTPSPLFNAVSSGVETGGVVASNSSSTSSSSSGGGGVSYSC